MKIKIATSLPLDILRRGIKEAKLQSRVQIINNQVKSPGVEVYFGQYSKIKFPTEKLRWIQLDSVDYSGLNMQKGIQVTTIAGVFSDEIAQTILGSILGVYRGLYDAYEAQKKNVWRRWEIRRENQSLNQAKVLILGGGSVAHSLVKYLKPYKTESIVFRRQNKKIKDAIVITTKRDLQKILKRADIVINALPLNDQTKGFLSAEYLKLVSPNVMIINVGRGLTMDESTAINMLKQKKIGALILDVTKQEPLTYTSSYWGIPRLYLTQHTAGGVANELEIKCRFFCKNLNRYLNHQKLLNRVTL